MWIVHLRLWGNNECTTECSGFPMTGNHWVFWKNGLAVLKKMNNSSPKFSIICRILLVVMPVICATFCAAAITLWSAILMNEMMPNTSICPRLVLNVCDNPVKDLPSASETIPQFFCFPQLPVQFFRLRIV